MPTTRGGASKTTYMLSSRRVKTINLNVANPGGLSEETTTIGDLKVLLLTSSPLVFVEDHMPHSFPYSGSPLHSTRVRNRLASLRVLFKFGSSFASTARLRWACAERFSVLHYFGQILPDGLIFEDNNGHMVVANEQMLSREIVYSEMSCPFKLMIIDTVADADTIGQLTALLHRIGIACALAASISPSRTDMSLDTCIGMRAHMRWAFATHRSKALAEPRVRHAVGDADVGRQVRARRQHLADRRRRRVGRRILPRAVLRASRRRRHRAGRQHCAGVYVEARSAWRHAPLETSYRGSRYGYRRLHTRAVDMPLGDADIHAQVLKCRRGRWRLSWRQYRHVISHVCRHICRHTCRHMRRHM